MADIAGVLKAEIMRLSSKTVRQASASIKKSSATHRREIAALKKKLAVLERQIGALKMSPAKKPRAPSEDATGASHRFSAKGLRTHRSRLGISQEEFGKLVGVSTQSVYNWERGSVRPRAEQIAAIAGIRALGKREVSKRLEALAAE